MSAATLRSAVFEAMDWQKKEDASWLDDTPEGISGLLLYALIDNDTLPVGLKDIDAEELIPYVEGWKRRELVFEALDNAIKNGYESVKTDPVPDVARDLCGLRQELEQTDPDCIHDYITEWRRRLGE